MKIMLNLKLKGNVVMMVAQDESYCVGIEARHDNILLSALQQ